jgi:hypothetical protein
VLRCPGVLTQRARYRREPQERAQARIERRRCRAELTLALEGRSGACGALVSQRQAALKIESPALQVGAASGQCRQCPAQLSRFAEVTATERPQTAVDEVTDSQLRIGARPEPTFGLFK